MRTALNYEAKESYEVVVLVSDGKDATSATDESVDATKAVVISVADLEEEGVITFSLPYPEVGVPLKCQCIGWGQLHNVQHFRGGR